LIKADLAVDVTAACDLGRALSIVATVFLPEPERLVENQPVVFAVPGGGYSRGYYDMRFAGHDGYSQAEHHVSHGLAVVAIDHLGVGESSPEVAESLRIEDIAAANDVAVRAIAERLRDGTAVDGYPAVDVGSRIGMGQSMGGGVSVIMAARHHSYDAVAVLGYSAIHTVLPMPDPNETARASEFFDYTRDTATGEMSIAESSAHIGEFLYPFFREDVPRDIVEEDTRGGYPIRTSSPPFGSLSIPLCVVAMLSPGYIKAEAAVLGIPVFIGVGDRDVTPEPHREPAAYEKATDITLFVCERMAHMHNFATTRLLLWDRLAHWSATVAAQRQPAVPTPPVLAPPG
jgi:pimeloyl-ACP methyl ester carboxylesterase